MGYNSLSTYEFIVVGAGASGCTIASRLARSAKRPHVLLVEAGGRNDTNDCRIDAERWLHRFNPAQAWGYQTIPQKELHGRVLSYDRGKGLGGSTATNFSCWNIGPAADHDEIARLVGDDEWKWKNAKKRYISLESYHSSEVPEGFKKYLNPDSKDHGFSGPIHIGFPAVWEKSMMEQLDIWIEAGYKSNPDLSSGDPIGFNVCPNSASRGIRSTAADQLCDAPENLQIVIETQVARVLFDGHRAIGIETLNGNQFRASKEVILSAGSLDTPRILMHSGVGPKDQLEKFQIPIVRENANIGQNLKDHHHIAPTWERNDYNRARQEFYRSKKLQAAARAQWEHDQTGPLAEIGVLTALGMLKSDTIYRTSEFKALSETTRAHMSDKTVPSHEIILNANVAHYFIQSNPESIKAVLAIYVFILNTQSTGSVTLQSSDPSVPLLFDPNYFSHPYDHRLAVEATRDVLKMVSSEAFQKDNIGPVDVPNSGSEEDILEYWKASTESTWHMTGTVKMGKKEGENGACIGTDFRPFGVKGLRVADMSVVPLIPNNHTQTTAYLVGLTAGDKLSAEYSLDD